MDLEAGGIDGSWLIQSSRVIISVSGKPYRMLEEPLQTSFSE